MRPTKKEHFIAMAKTVAEMSTCLRRKVGVVLVKEGVIVSSGYCGAPRGSLHCTDLGKCHRQTLGIPSGERYELCRSVHAEMNAVINAARSGISILGADMYMYSERIGSYPKGDGGLVGMCTMCCDVMQNAGIKEIYIEEP